jgi:hypothetical protein
LVWISLFGFFFKGQLATGSNIQFRSNPALQTFSRLPAIKGLFPSAPAYTSITLHFISEYGAFKNQLWYIKLYLVIPTAIIYKQASSLASSEHNSSEINYTV